MPNNSRTGGDNPFNTQWDEQQHGQNFDWFREAFDPETARYANDRIEGVGVPTQIQHPGEMLAEAESRINGATNRASPYDLGLGNTSRDGYAAALEKLHNGTSTVGGQADRAMGQLGSQVSAAAGNTSRGLGQALASNAGAAGGAALADQAGQARLNEFTNQQNAYGQGLGAMRGQDLSQANASQAAGLAGRQQDDAVRNFYGDKMADMGNVNADLELNAYKLRRRLDLQKQAKNQQTGTDIAQVVGMIAKLFGMG